MGLNEVVNTLERVEQLIEDDETGPAQDSLSWQRAGLLMVQLLDNLWIKVY